MREVRMAGKMIDAFGVLYGVRHGETVRIVSTRGRAGLDPIGVFASRVRGEVFLTEQDLERFEKAEASIALVISGEKAGFFVRNASGSIETVRSYEEFSIHDGPVAVATTPATPALKKRSWRWAYVLALLPLLYCIPHRPDPPLAVALREDAGQLRISWSLPQKETLMILDGGDLTTISIKPEQSMLTYARRTGDVVVKIGSAQARFVGPPLPPTELERMQASIENLKFKIAELRANKAAGQQRIATLQRRLQ
jgi:hypothetical protein